MPSYGNFYSYDIINYKREKREYNMIEDIGRKIKELRNSQNLTLKELSEKTNLSIGFLSQLERGLTTIAVDTLYNLAKSLGVDLSYFLVSPKENKKIVLRSYEKELIQINSNQFIYYNLTNSSEDKVFLPRYIEILPRNNDELVTQYQHEGQEFVYVMEGILTLVFNNETYELYPGDSAHYDSSIIHNWSNRTSMTVKMITVHTPNFLQK